ncbi:BLUF domain-containing protein [Marilutibacter aestuarii]|uniref:BLUF domain-containing protein n=1 Tax=Marilutibacter aestuarii TaxID=1706195 RepID=A0A508AFP1_9GAMM|nr:BLUF domain-containing protein [Lysobacter aestuarii]TQD47733.1 BLUF domain-containing protein [Lysobacter aestuarii]
MSDLIAIAYTSTVCRGLPPWAMDALLMDARRFNDDVGVSGVLFHHRGAFFQYFEGPAKSVDAVYGRIRAARSHDNIRELLRQSISRRQFSTWTMAFCETPRSVAQADAHAAWLEEMPVTRDTVECPESLSLILYYWNKWQADTPPRRAATFN